MPRGRRGTSATWVGSPQIGTSWREVSAGLGVERRYDPGLRLFCQSDPGRDFFFLKSGLVKAAVFTESGQECLVEIMGPGSLFGDGPAFEAGPRLVTATAVTRVVAHVYRVAEVCSHAETRPELLSCLLRASAAKQRSLIQRLVQASTMSPEDRVVDLFQRVAAASAGSGLDADTLLTHEELASYLGLSRITVTRTIGRLRRRGLWPP